MFVREHVSFFVNDWELNFIFFYGIKEIMLVFSNVSMYRKRFIEDYERK